MVKETDERRRDLLEKARQNLTDKFHPLRAALAKQEDLGDLELFDTLVDNYEFELALHFLCDYLLEQQGCGTDIDTIERIAVLHSEMEIQDNCVALLSAKARSAI